MITLQNYDASYAKRTKNGNTVAHSAAEKGSLRALRYCIVEYSAVITIPYTRVFIP